MIVYGVNCYRCGSTTLYANQNDAVRHCQDHAKKNPMCEYEVRYRPVQVESAYTGLGKVDVFGHKLSSILGGAS